MKIDQVAAQLYTVRDHAKTPIDLASTLKKVADIGYRAVQVSGICALPEAELNSMLADNGLVCCATHESGQAILDTPEKIVDRLAALNCKYTAYPYPAGVDFTTKAGIMALASGLDRSGKILRDAGQVLAYHNHATEFLKVEGKTVLDWIYDSTDPQNLVAELDTYWVQAGGGDPVAWCAKLDGRLPLIHLKDYAINGDSKPVFAEIGSGNMNFAAIIARAEASGCEWFIVEQDTCPADPFESLTTSFRYIQEHLVS